ncbi:MAG: LD-carboxypeptidase [Bacteroidetes bacterium]|nr:LD-carboxypeptidase [Bacteroidota bacterium]
MNRKNFLTLFSPWLIPASSVFAGKKMQDVPMIAGDEDLSVTIPPYLRKGDMIGITSPAGYITLTDIQPAISKLTEWGFTVKTGNSIGKRDFTFGGTDDERLADFQQMLDDKNIKAILCARGGYGTIRIVDKLNFTKFLLHPKWIIGFSDVTVLLNHIDKNCRMAGIHSKMCNSFPDNWLLAEDIQKETIESIRACLTGNTMNYTAAPNTRNKEGVCIGQLTGGNLKIIESLAGTSSSIDTRNKILFLEDTGEYLYSIDRMFWNLKRSGKLAALRGLIIGGFKIKKDDEGEVFGKSLEDIVLEKVKEYTYPVCFDFPVGHQKNNYALKCGIVHRLQVTPTAVSLTEQ